MLLCSLCVSLFSGIIPLGDEFAIQRTLAFFFFFMLGYYSNDIDIRLVIGKVPLWIAILLICLLLSSFLLLPQFTVAQTPVFLCNLPYWTDGAFIMRLVCRFCFIPTSILISCLFIRIIPNFTLFAKHGKKTLFVYGYHFIIIVAFYNYLYEKFIPGNVFSVLTSSIVIFIVLIGLSQIRFLNILLNPICFLGVKFNKRKT